MNKKYLIILIILAIITLGSVNAADNDENLTATTDNEIIAIEETQTTYDDVETQNILTANSNEENIISAGETGTFSELQDLINNANSGDTIELNKDYKFDNSYDSSLTSGIKINIDGLTILGNNHILDADGKGRIFLIDSSNIVLKDIIFINGKLTGTSSTDYGAAVRFEGNGEIINSTFINNYARDGGAVFWAGSSSEGKIINSTFIGNSVSRNGGAVYSNENKVDIINNIFNNNNAPSNHGGAVYSYKGTGNIINGTFYNNNAKSNGGAIYLSGDNVKIIQSNFINSTAGSGAGVYVAGNNVLLANLTFINSSATGSGGVFYINGASATIVNVTAYNSSAVTSGGAIFISTEGSKILNSTFYNNVASNAKGTGGNGGAVYYNNANNALINGSKFINSTAGGYAGAIYVAGSSSSKNFKIDNSIFINNAANSFGGFLYYYGSTGSIISNSLIINSSAIVSNNGGGAIYWGAGDTGSIINSTFINSTSSKNGGAIYWSQKDGSFINNTFINNIALDGNGGAIYITGVSGTVIENLTLINNSATKNGGGIYLSSDADVISSKFIGNNATYGAAIYIGGSNVNVLNSNFVNNSAIEGGAIYVNDNTALISYSNFTGNNATNGGAIYLSDTLDDTITSSLFINNTASSTGGAIYFEDHEGNSYHSKVSDSKFINNSAYDAGAIYWKGTSYHSSSLVNSIFINNYATNNGGAIYVYKYYDGEISDLDFQDNSALNGGAIYITSSDYAQIYNSKFKNNSASNNGDAIYWDDDNDGAIISQSTFEGDSKVAIYSTGELRLRENILNDNNYIYLASGSISTETRIIVLGNETKQGTLNYNLTAVITDDNNNTIVLADSYAKLKFILPDESEIEASQNNLGVWSAEYVFDEFDAYLISASNVNFASAKIYTGIADANVILYYANIDISVDDINYTETATVTITLNNTAEGSITIYLNGEVYQTIDLNDNSGEFTLDLSNLNAGAYTISANYTGDDYFTEESSEKTFNVAKINPTIIISADDIEVDEAAKITATLPSDAIGEITITLNDNNPEPVNNGVQIEIPDLEVNTYEVVVNFKGDNNYNAFENRTTFKVNKKQSTVEITATTPIVYGQETVITVTVSEGATGKVIISINDEEKEIDLSETTSISYTLTGIGQYTINAVYEGDDKFEESESDDFTIEVIDKTTPTIKITVPDEIEIGKELEITIETDGNNPVVEINGKEYEINNGKVVFAPENTGVYTIFVKTSENATYKEAYNYTSFSVDKINPTITIDEVIGAEINKEIEFTINNDTPVTVKVNGVEIENNKFTPENAGTYTVIVESQASETYNAGFATLTFTASKKESEISLTVDETSKTIGNDLIITPNVDATTGIVIINVNGTEYSLNIEKENSLTITLTNPGSYTINATYLGNEIYTQSEVSDNLVVSVADKLTPTYTISIEGNVEIGETITINVVPTNAPDTYTITVNGETYTGSYVIASEGQYTIKVENIEDDSYYAASETEIISAVKNTQEITITVNPTANVGDEVKFTINNLTEATVKVNGEIVSDYKFTPDKEGKYTITVEAAENDKYTDAFTTATVEVSKKDIDDFTITVDDSKLQDENILTVTVNNLAEGIVNINVNDVTYTLDLTDGNLKEISLTTPGVYNIQATYAGDDEYNDHDATNTESVELKNVITPTYTINVEGDAKVGNTITVTINSDIDEFTVTLNGETQTLTDNKFTFTPENAGEYVITVSNTESGNIKANTDSTTINVVKNTPEIEIENINDVKVGEEVTITISNDTEVTVKVNGETISDNKFTPQKAGNYIVVVEASENDKYTQKIVTTSFNVIKDTASIDITVDGEEKTIGSQLTITVNTPLSEGNVIIKVNDVDYIINIQETTDLTIPLTTAGSYTVSATYVENDKFESATSDVKSVNVLDKQTPDVNIIVDNEYKIDSTVAITIETTGFSPVLTINGEVQTIEDNKVVFNPQSTGSYLVVLTTEENETTYSSSISKVFTVTSASILNPTITIADVGDVYVGDKIVISASANSGSDLTITVNGQNIENGAEFIPEYAGEYTIIVKSAGNDVYNAGIEVTNFTVSKKSPVISIDVDSNDKSIGDVLEITVSSELNEGIVLVNVGDSILSFDLNKTKSLTTTLTKAGSYIINATYVANNVYESAISQNIEVNVKDKTTPEIIITVPEEIKVNSEIEITIQSEGEIQTVTINGETQTVEQNTVKFTPTYAGKYTIIVKTIENTNFYENTNSTIFEAVNIEKNTPEINIAEINNVNIGDNVTVNVTSNGDGALTITVNSAEIENGASLELTESGTYTIIVKSTETDNFKEAFVTSTFTVPVKENNKQSSDNSSNNNNGTNVAPSANTPATATTVSLKSNANVNTFYNSLDKYKLRVFINGKAAGAGEKVTVNFNGKKTTVTTDANGWVSFNVAGKAIKVAKYTITAEYKGVKVSNTITIKNVINAKKTTKVKRTAKSFKVKITLKGKKVLKKQTVKVKFKGKTYTLKTNNKGVATLKVAKKVIKKLKKGKTYSYTITYNKDVIKRYVKVTK